MLMVISLLLVVIGIGDDNDSTPVVIIDDLVGIEKQQPTRPLKSLGSWDHGSIHWRRWLVAAPLYVCTLIERVFAIIDMFCRNVECCTNGVSSIPTPFSWKSCLHIVSVTWSCVCLLSVFIRKWLKTRKWPAKSESHHRTDLCFGTVVPWCSFWCFVALILTKALDGLGARRTEGSCWTLGKPNSSMTKTHFAEMVFSQQTVQQRQRCQTNTDGLLFRVVHGLYRPKCSTNSMLFCFFCCRIRRNCREHQSSLMQEQLD